MNKNHFAWHILTWLKLKLLKHLKDFNTLFNKLLYKGKHTPKTINTETFELKCILTKHNLYQNRTSSQRIHSLVSNVHFEKYEWRNGVIIILNMQETVTYCKGLQRRMRDNDYLQHCIRVSSHQFSRADPTCFFPVQFPEMSHW